jgi:hypothetical protein
MQPDPSVPEATERRPAGCDDCDEHRPPRGNPVTLRARSCPTCHSIGIPRYWAEEIGKWVDVPPQTNISDKRCADAWHTVEATEPDGDSYEPVVAAAERQIASIHTVPPAAFGQLPNPVQGLIDKGIIDESAVGLFAPAFHAEPLYRAQDCGHDPERIERHERELRAKSGDLVNIRGLLSPNGYPRVVPMDLGATVAPAVEWLIGERDRLAETTEETLRRLCVLAGYESDAYDEGEQGLGPKVTMADALDDIQERISLLQGALKLADQNWRTRKAENEQLADTVRQYQPVIDAAKAWRVAARASEVFRLEASFETGTTMADLSTAVDALDASPGDAQTGQRDDEPAGTETGDDDG